MSNGPYTMKIVKIRRGYNIPIKGKPQSTLERSPSPTTVGVTPSDFYGIKPKLEVKQGDPVKLGTPLFHDKLQPDIKFVSPASGTVQDIVYGPRRSLEKIIISPTGEDAIQHHGHSVGQISKVNRETLVQHLLQGGVWPFLRRRPFNTIARPHEIPSSIFVNAMDTTPLSADVELALQGNEQEYQAGMETIRVLANGKVHVVADGKNNNSPFLNVEGVEKYGFIGKHPAGLVGSHIAHIDPIHTTKVVWHLNARDVISIGSFMLHGKFPTHRIVAVAGSGLQKNLHLQSHAGAKISDLLRDNLKSGAYRILSGNVLTGRISAEDDYIGFYDNLITVIPEGGQRSFLGWLSPGFKKSSYGTTFLSSMIPGATYDMNTSVNGERRAFVMSGNYRQVTALDIYPDMLAKAIISEDIDQMERLGLLETDPEDVALCSYICPSKIEFTEIYRRGLDLFEKEIS